MHKIVLLWGTALLMSSGPFLHAQSTTPTLQAPPNATACDLADRPPAWDHVRVRVTAVAAHEFETFSLDDPSCPIKPSSTRIWLTYGGRLSAETAFCCPGEPDRSLRPKTL